ncbi:MAG: exosortase/archaeosortase family protein [Akkermansiaceae bacterium]
MDHQEPQTFGSLWENPSKTTRILLYSILGVFLFFYLVYQAFPTVYGKSLAGWTWHACNPINNFLHGRFIPVAFVIMIYLAYQQVKDEPLSSQKWGLILLVFGLLFYLFAVRTIQPRLASIGAPFALVGASYYLFGHRVARHFVFPAFFLWFAIPVPGLETLLTEKLQLFITEACYQSGMFIGMDLIRSGNDITVVGSGADPVKIAEGCSGMRSLMALTMIAAVYAYYTQKPLWKKALLFSTALPLAIIGNFGRIFTILVITKMGYPDFAKQTYHDWAGLLIFFPIALSGLYVFDYLLNRKQGRKKVKVTKATKATKPSTAG